MSREARNRKLKAKDVSRRAEQCLTRDNDQDRAWRRGSRHLMEANETWHGKGAGRKTIDMRVGLGRTELPLMICAKAEKWQGR